MTHAEALTQIQQRGYEQAGKVVQPTRLFSYAGQ